MPITSTSPRDIRVTTLYASGDRMSNIEHLQHMSRLTDAKSGQFPKGGGVDFSRPPPTPNSPVTTTDRLKRRTQIDETRIVFENNLLLSKMADHNSQDLRLKNALSLVPAPKDESSYPRLSNLQPRTAEARRIDQANLTLGERIQNSTSTVSNKAAAASTLLHNELMARISKFKPTLHNEPFVGATLMLKEGGVDLLADNPRRWGTQSPRGGGSPTKSPRSKGNPMESRYGTDTSWHHSSLEDIKHSNLITDRYYHRTNPNNGDATSYTVHRALGGSPAVTPSSKAPHTSFPQQGGAPRHSRYNTDTVPEALQMDFTDHNHGTGRICSKGCFLPHHLQRGEWKAVATARDAQRRIEHEQFSITNQLEIQRAARLGTEPRIQYSSDAMRMVSKAHQQTESIGNPNAGGVSSPSVHYGHQPYVPATTSSGSFAYPAVVSSPRSHHQRPPPSLTPVMPPRPPGPVSRGRPAPSDGLEHEPFPPSANTSRNVPMEAEESHLHQQKALTITTSDPSVEPTPLSPPPTARSVNGGVDEDSPERPATQRAPSIHSSRVGVSKSQHQSGYTYASGGQPHPTRESGNQERLLSRANFNSEVLIDDGRLYLFENVEFGGYARR